MTSADRALADVFEAAANASSASASDLIQPRAVSFSPIYRARTVPYI